MKTRKIIFNFPWLRSREILKISEDRIEEQMGIGVRARCNGNLDNFGLMEVDQECNGIVKMKEHSSER